MEQIKSNDVVNKGAKQVQETADGINTSIQEQKTAIAEIVKSLTIITELTQSNAFGAEEIAANSEELSASADSLQEKISFLKFKLLIKISLANPKFILFHSSAFNYRLYPVNTLLKLISKHPLNFL